MNYRQNILAIGLILASFIFGTSCQQGKTNQNKLSSSDIASVQLEALNYADPTIFYHDGTYYLYGTVENIPNVGFEVFVSKNLQDWEGPYGAKDGFALHKDDVFGDKGFWAPQVFFHNEKFYMAYTANEQIAIATSDSPLGPFVQEEKKEISGPVRQIDPFVFFDDDGKVYLYSVRLQDGNRLFVAEMLPDLSGIIEESVRECISAIEPWENTQNVTWPVAEGPTIVKENGLYYFIYSTNDFRNPDYAVGYATSDNPIGPWEKVSHNPILEKSLVDQNGTGHGDLFEDGNGELHYVFHTHFSKENPKPRKTAIIKAKFETDANNDAQKNLVFDPESFRFLNYKK
ncbi:glycoside hydrolase family 43 protein [Belliella sp. DSM 111904]|uniref:Glycoside hydrolase family 43 protein n=1 Tax=Belliella filtrata TaxID=2923435 RepID=A0ABS9V4J3_9BACT|nr:glycoside hydrolase family 43 protein [Belliella filtrata]MCH7411304.1 glycoside hydrolase family 43 protein [Belliella filtrata]